MKIEIRKASCKVEMEYFREGSVLKGTVHSRWTQVRSFLSFDSDSHEERLSLLIKALLRTDTNESPTELYGQIFDTTTVGTSVCLFLLKHS